MRKTRFRILMALLSLTLIWPSALADTSTVTNVPEAITSALSGSRWSGYEVASITQAGHSTTGYAYEYDSASGVGAVVVTNGKMNILCMLGSNGKGGSRITAYSDKAVLQGDDIPGITLHDNRITVWYLNDSGEAYDLSYTFRRRDGIWILNNLAWYSAAMGNTIAVEVYDNKLTYTIAETGNAIGTANGVYGRKLEQFNVNTFPRQLADAKASLSNPPAIPESLSPYGLPQPVEVEFASNGKYPVYSGPGEHYLRGANGKAALSTNDWIQVFGRVGDWILVQYDIGSDHMRFGYIDADALPKGTRLESLSFLTYPVKLLEPCALTDDPLYSGALLGTPDTDEVTFLAWLGNDWAYVEATVDGVKMRGFVPADFIEDFVNNGFHG